MKKTKKKVVKKPTKKRKVIKRKTAGKRSVVVSSKVLDKDQFVLAADLADSELIASELSGKEDIEYWVYEMDIDGEIIRELTAKGVREANWLINRNPKYGMKLRIHPGTLKVERDLSINGEGGVTVSVYAENQQDGMGGFGSQFEPYNTILEGGAMIPNKFAEKIALGKAERQAIRKLIPETVAQALIKKFIKDRKKVKKITAPKKQTQVKTMPAPKPTAKEAMTKVFQETILQCKTVQELEEFKAKLNSNPLATAEQKASITKLIDEAIKQRNEKKPGRNKGAKTGSKK